jgi:3-deoxy-D-manno-octulosonic-acid transferase
MFLIYQFLITILIILSPIIILVRILRNKEDPKRFIEKFFLTEKIKQKGNIIWFHAASVGEFLSITPLIYELEKNNKIKKILITTSTLSSSKVFNDFKFKKTYHRFFPIDSFFFSKKFIDYWNPKVAIFIDSEIWPNMFKEIKKKSIPLLLMNARITKKTFRKWSFFKSFSDEIFGKITKAYPQNNETFNYLKKLNVKNIKKIGNLKYSKNRNLEILTLQKSLLSSLKDKIIFVASSTHSGEEKMIANAHLILKKKFKNFLTILIPRHINRCYKIIEELKPLNLKILLHKANNKINNKTDIYLINTFGETKKFFKQADLTFIGGSIIRHGGQNPIEPAHFGLRILHGPNVQNFKEVYELLKKRKISYKVKNSKEIVNVTKKLLTLKKQTKIDLKSIGDSILRKSVLELNEILNNEIKKTKILGQ